ncbi:MAG TPA: Rieske 2Fe-2S domain-containing protein [Candidatus Acidoferrum sp.]|nr:Rieske 2Fe-2S domain-containing protein [Candidatus Acidoferrum sp.]
MGIVSVAKLSELAEGSGKHIKIDDDTEIALFKVDGKVYAVQQNCPHHNGPLSDGSLSGPIVTCPWHGMTYDVTTGKAAPDAWDQDYQLKTYKVHIEGDDVKLEI